MAKPISLKQLAIDKDNTMIVIVVGVAVFIIIFSLVACNALLKQRTYQSGIITKKEAALKQLKTNVTEVNKLKGSYQAFASSSKNALGGDSAGKGERDGENPRLILDALPSKYDFPALTTSIEKLFKPYGLTSITGTDDEIGQSASAAAPTGEQKTIPFSVALNSNAQSFKPLMLVFERSIRPIKLDSLSISGNESDLKIAVNANTYYQPPIGFSFVSEEKK